MTTETKFYIAIDVGGTKIRGAVVSSTGEVRAPQEIPVHMEGSKSLFERVSELIQRVRGFLPHHEREKVSAIGVAVPAVVDPASGDILLAPNLPEWNGFPLRKALKEQFGVPVAVDFDGICSVVGEHWKGAGAGSDNVSFLIIGTGIGLGAIVDGHLLRGASNVVGGVGWWRNMGDLASVPIEVEHAGPGIARRALSAAGRLPDGGLLARVAEKRQLSAKDVFAALENDDPAARKVIEETVDAIGFLVANIVSILNPERVILGGGVGRQLGPFLGRINGTVLEVAQPIAARRVQVLVSTLGQDFGLIGAARLAMIAGAAKNRS